MENLNAFVGGKAPFKVTTTTKVVPEKRLESIAADVQLEKVDPLEVPSIPDEKSG